MHKLAAAIILTTALAAPTALALPVTVGPFTFYPDGCDGGGPALLVTMGDGGDTTWYWEIRDLPYATTNDWWLYEESNGLEGLQRGGSSPIVPDDNEVCDDHSISGPDTLIF